MADRKCKPLYKEQMLLSLIRTKCWHAVSGSRLACGPQRSDSLWGVIRKYISKYNDMSIIIQQKGPQWSDSLWGVICKYN